MNHEQRITRQRRMYLAYQQLTALPSDPREALAVCEIVLRKLRKEVRVQYGDEMLADHRDAAPVQLRMVTPSR